jgi:hypothetical protein
MSGLRSTMRDSTFTFWELPVEELPLTWENAKQHLAEQARLDAAKGSSGR